MKTIVPLLICFLITMSACEKSDIEHESSFERSYQSWQNFKASCNDSYRYVTTGGTWTGSSWTTKIIVRNGEVVQRDFRYDAFYDLVMPPQGWDEHDTKVILDQIGLTDEEFAEKEGRSLMEVLQWTEEKDKLSGTPNTPASAAMTLDEIYDMAQKTWLQKRTGARIFFEAKNNGLISSAGYMPDGCMDDCFSGINILSIEAL